MWATLPCSINLLKPSVPSELTVLLQVIESQEHCLKICSAIKAVADQLGLCFVFKARCAQSCG